ncbi:MAG TPA: restriction endonuclease subunit R, partial [Acetivibrio sp.]|nr:restriction endonuclease subunit R [Acetivibrio sp.]
ENNLQHEIVRKMSSNSVYYGKMSEMLKKIILQRKAEAMSYEEYLRQVVELAEAILHPETTSNYPDEVKDSAARRALYDYFQNNVELAVDVDNAIRISIQPEWKRNFQKQQRIRLAIYKKLLAHMYTEDRATEETNNVFEIVQRQEEYDA